jgi:hypothetical protein
MNYRLFAGLELQLFLYTPVYKSKLEAFQGNNVLVDKEYP